MNSAALSFGYQDTIMAFAKTIKLPNAIPNFGSFKMLPNYRGLGFGRETLNEDRRQKFAANRIGAAV